MLGLARRVRARFLLTSTSEVGRRGRWRACAWGAGEEAANRAGVTRAWWFVQLSAAQPPHPFHHTTTTPHHPTSPHLTPPHPTYLPPQVYGDPLEHPQTESYWGNVNPIGERSCYDEGKRAAECLTMDYHREHGIEVGVCGGEGGCFRACLCACVREGVDG
jgi:hypothetical protein